MIKKILTVLFGLCLVAPMPSSGATLRITEAQALRKILEKHLSNDQTKVAAVMQVYADSLLSNGGKISTNANEGVSIEMCKAAGLVDKFDTSQDPLTQRLEAKANAQQAAMQSFGFGTWGVPSYVQEAAKANQNAIIYYPTDKCKALIKDIAWGATGLYYNLCGVENRKHIAGQTKCVRSFYEFQGQISSAVGMAKEWAKLPKHNEYGKDNIVCENNYRTISNDDYIRCKSLNTRRYYDFQFDDVRESFDDTIRGSILDHISWLHGGTVGVTQQKCNEIAETASVFNVGAKFYQKLGGSCMLKFNDKSSSSQLRTACGINPFEFMVGDDIQINATLGVDAQLRNYVAGKCGVEADDVKCTAAAASYTGDGGEYGNSIIFDGGDDIITCSYSQKDATSGQNKRYYIDFVFDDMSELNKSTVNAGNQAMGCKVQGGSYDGKNCMHLTKETCDKINENMAANCSSCAKAYWDSKEGICRLPDAATKTEQADAIEAALLVVGTAAAIAITVVTGGTGAFALALVAVETTGAVIEGVSTHQINQALDAFFKESNKCKDAKCAASLIKKGMERIVDFANDMEDGQVHGFDTEMARLFLLLPPESDIVQDILAQYEKDNGIDLTVAGNKGGFFDADSWQPEQVWRAVGVAMQFISVLKSISNWLFKGGKAAQTVLTKTDDAVRVTLTRAQAVNLDNWAAQADNLFKQRQAAGLTKSKADDLWRQYKTVTQNRTTLLNSLGLADQSDDVIKLMQREAYLADDLAKASDDLAKATTRADNLYTINKNGQRVLAQGVTKHDVRDVQRAIDAAQSSIDDITRNLDDVTKQLDDIFGVGKTTTTVVTTGADDAARLVDNGIATGAAAKVAILEGRNQLLKPDDLYTSPTIPNTEGVVEPVQRDMEKLPELNGITGTAVMMGPGAGLAGAPKTAGAGVPDIVFSDVEIEDEEIEIEDVEFDFGDDDFQIKKFETSTPSKSSSSSSTKADKSYSGVKAKEVKDPLKTGLIATAAVLGAVGTGALIGGLVSRDKDEKNSSVKTNVNTDLEKELEVILENSNQALGVVDGNTLTLVPMQTVAGTTAKIININGNAVAVVNYRGHNLPYYVNASAGTWVPLLGVGQTGGWFNTYLSNTPSVIVSQIQTVLNQRLAPISVAKFVDANALGVQFPVPAPEAYGIINAEFPNGVIETFNGVFSPEEQTLYNNNYQRINSLFTIAQLGGFFVDT